MKKYSKTFGEVEVIDNNGTISTIKIVKTGETKKVMNSSANLQDEPFEKEVKAIKKAARELTEEEKEHLAFINRNGSALLNTMKKSNMNYRNGKSGASSL
jgi:DNA repair protein RadC